jgi:hypothetical protein
LYPCIQEKEKVPKIMRKNILLKFFFCQIIETRIFWTSGTWHPHPSQKPPGISAAGSWVVGAKVPRCRESNSPEIPSFSFPLLPSSGVKKSKHWGVVQKIGLRRASSLAVWWEILGRFIYIGDALTRGVYYARPRQANLDYTGIRQNGINSSFFFFYQDNH